jgi:hypothetical protein
MMIGFSFSVFTRMPSPTPPSYISHIRGESSPLTKDSGTPGTVSKAPESPLSPHVFKATSFLTKLESGLSASYSIMTNQRPALNQARSNMNHKKTELKKSYEDREEFGLKAGFEQDGTQWYTARQYLKIKQKEVIDMSNLRQKRLFFKFTVLIAHFYRRQNLGKPNKVRIGNGVEVNVYSLYDFPLLEAAWKQAEQEMRDEQRRRLQQSKTRATRGEAPPPKYTIRGTNVH